MPPLQTLPPQRCPFHGITLHHGNFDFISFPSSRIRFDSAALPFFLSFSPSGLVRVYFGSLQRIGFASLSGGDRPLDVLARVGFRGPSPYDSIFCLPAFREAYSGVTVPSGETAVSYFDGPRLFAVSPSRPPFSTLRTPLPVFYLAWRSPLAFFRLPGFVSGDVLWWICRMLSSQQSRRHVCRFS